MCFLGVYEGFMTSAKLPNPKPSTDFTQALWYWQSNWRYLYLHHNSPRMIDIPSNEMGLSENWCIMAHGHLVVNFIFRHTHTTDCWGHSIISSLHPNYIRVQYPHSIYPRQIVGVYPISPMGLMASNPILNSHRIIIMDLFPVSLLMVYCVLT